MSILWILPPSVLNQSDGNEHSSSNGAFAVAFNNSCHADPGMHDQITTLQTDIRATRCRRLPVKTGALWRRDCGSKLTVSYVALTVTHPLTGIHPHE